MKRRMMALCMLLASGVAGCRSSPFEITPENARSITGTVVTDFLSRVRSRSWPRIYISDEFLPFTIDSAWLQALPSGGTRLEAAHRADVTESYDLVVAGALLIEPSTPSVTLGGTLSQALVFSSTAEFGGQLQYTLRKFGLLDWQIDKVTVVFVL